MEENTLAVAQNSTSKSDERAGRRRASVGSTIGSVLGFGLGLSPLISGLVSLFGGGGGAARPRRWCPYVAPPSVNAHGGDQRVAIGGVRSGYGGREDCLGAQPFVIRSKFNADYGAGAGYG